MFGGKFLNVKDGCLFISLLDEVLYKSWLTVLLLVFKLCLAISTLIFIPRLIFVIIPCGVHFYYTSQCLAVFLMLYLSTCYLFCCWNVLLVYFFLISSVPPPFLDLLFHTELFDFLSAKVCFILGACDWFKWIFKFSWS